MAQYILKQYTKLSNLSRTLERYDKLLKFKMDARLNIVLLALFIIISGQQSNAEYLCYHWTDEDRREMGPRPSVAAERAQCEKHSNIFTQGRNGAHPECGTCWCCEYVLSANTGGPGSSNLLQMICRLLKASNKPGTQCSS
ncbi:uncharacterized protein LOC123527087 [Mercenaria mercenaria]|uniref:uncharacterized protein LOC123527087 n=1 Tax=Mercenaria mercenaria TaxID=6596 RepID=UPI00234EB364|nr:uncharacterized protein LOC123527087 [Mercenaria mercenaria]